VPFHFGTEALSMRLMGFESDGKMPISEEPAVYMFLFWPSPGRAHALQVHLKK
jgi:hypothetical protein